MPESIVISGSWKIPRFFKLPAECGLPKNPGGHLNESQYITIQFLLLLLQVHRQVKLSVLASVFPQPIQYGSRKRNLQRFLNLPQLNVKLLWFPLIKYWIRLVQTGRNLNREQRRRLQRPKHHKYGYWIIAIDRTQWKGRNVFMVSLVWGTHAQHCIGKY